MNLKATLGIAGGVLATAGLATGCFIKGKKNGIEQGTNAGYQTGVVTGYQVGIQDGMRTTYNIYNHNFVPLEHINNQNISVIDLQRGIANMRLKSAMQLEQLGFAIPASKAEPEDAAKAEPKTPADNAK